MRRGYWSKYPDAYFVGDGARYDGDGDFWLMGRTTLVDPSVLDTMKSQVSGTST